MISCPGDFNRGKLIEMRIFAVTICYSSSQNDLNISHANIFGVSCPSQLYIFIFRDGRSQLDLVGGRGEGAYRALLVVQATTFRR